MLRYNVRNFQHRKFLSEYPPIVQALRSRFATNSGVFLHRFLESREIFTFGNYKCPRILQSGNLILRIFRSISLAHRILKSSFLWIYIPILYFLGYTPQSHRYQCKILSYIKCEESSNLHIPHSLTISALGLFF